METSAKEVLKLMARVLVLTKIDFRIYGNKPAPQFGLIGMSTSGTASLWLVLSRLTKYFLYS
jgi:hypothetical protein